MAAASGPRRAITRLRRLAGRVWRGLGRRGGATGSTGVVAEVTRLAQGYRDPREIARCDRRLVKSGEGASPDRVLLSKAAAKVGDLELALSIAEDMIARGAPSELAVELRDRSRDRLQILTSGWPRPLGRPEQPVYEPAHDSVLCVLSQSLPIRTGGYATRSHGIISAVSRAGWHVEAITRLGFPYDRWPADDPRDVAATDVVDGIRYHRALVPGQRVYPQVPLRDYLELSAEQIAEAARRQCAGLIHASSFYATGLAASNAAAMLGIPFVYEMRGLEDLMRTAAHAPFAESTDYRFLVDAETETCRRADHVLVITDALAEEMVRRGIPRAKITVVPNGVHVEDFTPAPRDEVLAAELGFTGRTVIGYLGGFPHYEGLRLLMRAVAALGKRRDDFRVLMVGDGQQDRALRRDVEELGLTDIVTFTGRVPHDDIPRYLSVTDITPFPRLPLDVCELISPMKPYEAMAMAKAVVVSDVAALAQIVQDGETGLTFAKGDAGDLADKLELLLEDPALRNRLGSAAREWVLREGNWAAIAERVDGVYRRFLPGRGPGDATERV
jgi:glycosyltransferase involved in cell wall biosynthesis